MDRRAKALAVLGASVGAAAPLHPSNPLWNVAAVTGIPRVREWDAVASVRAPGLPGDEVHFVAAPDGSLLVEEDVPDGALLPLAQALEQTIAPPYRARGVRHEDVWAVGAVRTGVVALPAEFRGDELELVVRGGRWTLTVDGDLAIDAPPALRALAPEDSPEDYVVIARRLDDVLWEAAVSPL